MEVSTIAAISTPPGHGGIGIIKISGPAAVPAALSVFIPKLAPDRQSTPLGTDTPAFKPKSRNLYYGHIVDKISGHVLDEVLFVVMRGPASYTGEDVVEIQSHAGPVVVQSILNLLMKIGVSLAAPGEFTRRAFLNGRMDLTQAEAVIDVITARSEKAMEMAAAQVSGDLQRKIQSIRASLLGTLSYVEAAIDFPEAVGDEIDGHFLGERLSDSVIAEIASLIERSANRAFLREGLKIVILGGPNVGKSSLMNRLIDKERSIVSDIPGTTRDFIEDTFISNGIPIVLTDTAGIHASADPVEILGIEKTWTTIDSADLLLFVADAGRSVSQFDLEIVSRLAKKNLIIVENKMDLPESSHKFEKPNDWRFFESVAVSARYNQGIDALKQLIMETVIRSTADSEDTIVPNLRHRQCLEKALLSLKMAREGLSAVLPFELISIDLKSALESLMEITGECVKPDILDQIFSRFCIGK